MKLIIGLLILINSTVIFGKNCIPQDKATRLVSYVSCSKPSVNCKKLKEGLSVDVRTKVYLDVIEARFTAKEKSTSSRMEADYISIKLSKNSACWFNSKMNKNTVGKKLKILLDDKLISSAVISGVGDRENVDFALSVKPELKSFNLCQEISKNCLKIKN